MKLQEISNEAPKMGMKQHGMRVLGNTWSEYIAKEYFSSIFRYIWISGGVFGVLLVPYVCVQKHSEIFGAGTLKIQGLLFPLCGGAYIPIKNFMERLPIAF